MNLAAIDLNLLVAFEALMNEQNVTRAGQKIGLAQSSMSNVLLRLRALLKDELFVRTGQGMRPTKKAEKLAPVVFAALSQLRQALDPGEIFDPRTAKHGFVIAATDYGDLIVVPPIVRALRQEAPGISLTVKPTTDRAEMLPRIERGEIDALIGGHLPDSLQTIRHRLFDERFVCLQDSKRSAGMRVLGRRQYLSLPHAWFSSTGEDGSPSDLDAMLSEQGDKRLVVVKLPHVVAVPFAIAGTDLIATITERIARRFARAAGVTIRPLPYAAPPIAVDLVHAKNRRADAALQWFVKLIIRVSKDL